jgi:predicted transcriptional regulator
MCKELSRENGKKSYIPLFKVIVALTMLSKKETITYTQITGMTGLSSYQIKEQLRILDEKNKIRIGRLQYEVKENYIRCIGRQIDINACETGIVENVRRAPREENIENKNAGVISEKPNIVIFKK